MITYHICNDCKNITNNGWATVLSNNEKHAFCCYTCYQLNPMILPIESTLKQTGYEKVVLPYNDNIIDDTNLENLEFGRPEDFKEYLEQLYIQELEEDYYASSSDISSDEYV